MTYKNTNESKAVILTALPVEYKAVKAHLTNTGEELHRAGTIYERGLFPAQSLTWDVGIAQIGMGNAGAAFEIERAIGHFQPHIVLFVGIAGGLKDVKLGDVVAATKVYGYESGKADVTFLPRPEVGNVAYVLEQRAKAEANKADWLQRLQQVYGTQPVPDPCVYTGPIAAGEKVISSMQSPEKMLLQANYGDALAVEMEGYGFLKAVHANQQVSALVIRGISDLIENKRAADAANYQEIAARHASAFAFEILAKLPGNELSYTSQTQANTQKMQESVDSPQPRRINHIHNTESTQEIMQKGNYNQQNNYNAPINNTYNTSYEKNEVAEGKNKIEQGKNALLDKDYISAKQCLEDALKSLTERQAPRDNAHARYLLVLAYLGRERPCQVTLQIMKHLEALMQGAIRLHPSYIYYYTLAILKKDFARNGWSQTHYLRTAQNHLNQAYATPFYQFDQECLNILKCCQPYLMAEVETW